MNINWGVIIQILIVGLFWGSFFTFGWFQTIIWTIIISAITGIIIRMRQNNY